MPRKTAKIVKANETGIIFETKVGADYRLWIPKTLRNFVKPKETVRVTIEKIEEMK